MQQASDRQKTIAAHGVPISDPRLPFVVLDLRTFKSVEGRVLVHGEEENAREAGRGYFLLEGTDARIYYVPYRPEIEDACNRGLLKTSSFVRLRKLFVDGEPLLDSEELCAAEAILGDRRHMRDAARRLLDGSILPDQEPWGGWLGRYRAALRAALIAPKHHEISAQKTSRGRSGAER